MDVFNPPYPPDYDGNGIEETPRILSVSFGDGYAMTAPDGLNPNEATAAYSWSVLSQSERDWFTKFYTDHIGQTVSWNMPDLSGVQKWRITKCSTAVSSHDKYSVTMSFKRSFEL